MNIAIVALGCEKNIINAEQMLYLLAEAGYKTTADPAEADVTVLNTCGFIEAARAEAIEQILALAETPTKIIVAGCMAEGFRDEIAAELPEVSGLVGTGRFDDIVTAIEAVTRGEMPKLFGKVDAPVSETPRLVSGAPYAYLKIAEGCSNTCAFCSIPKLRGKYRSRPLQNIIAEAEDLLASGVQELILIAQDTTRYGCDLAGGETLASLLRALCKLPVPFGIRVHYLYPEAITDDLIAVFRDEPKLLKYLDIPIQHAADGVLRAMRRPSTRASLGALFAKLRHEIPGVVLRSTVMVGFPGETDAAFETLCDFLAEAKIERCGCFAFSCEEGTIAADLPDHVDADIAAHRKEIVEHLQTDIMSAFHQTLVGQTLRCIADPEGFRSAGESPDVDGVIVAEGTGTIAGIHITHIAHDGTLCGVVSEQ